MKGTVAREQPHAQDRKSFVHRFLPYAIGVNVPIEVFGVIARPSGTWLMRFLWIGLVVSSIALVVSSVSTRWKQLRSRTFLQKIGVLLLFYFGLAFALSFAYSVCYVYDTDAFCMRIGDLQRQAAEAQKREAITRRFAFNTAIALFAHPEFITNNWFMLARPWGPPGEKEFLGALIGADPEHAPVDSLDKLTAALSRIPSGEREQLARVIAARFQLTAYTTEEISDRYGKVRVDLEDFVSTGRCSALLLIPA